MADLHIVPSGTDAEFAESIKKRLAEKLAELCIIADEAKDHGFHVTYGTQQGPIGKHIITQILVAKIF